MKSNRIGRWLVGALLVVRVVVVQPSCTYAALGDLLYPRESINDNIDHMEQATRRLIELFGKTVDETTLRLLTRTLLAIDDLKIAYRDSLDLTFDKISAERRSAFYDISALLQQTDDALSRDIGNISEIEQRFSNTLTRVLRGPQTPWLLSYSPVAFFSRRPSDLMIHVTGQHLQNSMSVLKIKGREIAAASAAAGNTDFVVPKNLLSPDNDGLVHATLSLVSPEPASIWNLWYLWNGPEVSTYRIFLRPLTDRVGTYSIEAHGVDNSTIGKTVSKDSLSFKTELDTAVEKSADPKNQEHCILASELTDPGKWEFEPGKTEAVATTNNRHGIRLACIIGMGLGANINSPQCIVDSSNAAPTVTVDHSDKICMRFLIDLRSPDTKFSTGKIEGFLRYSIKRTEAVPWDFKSDGDLFWNKDESIRLPSGGRGFKLSFAFSDSGENRLFFGPGTYGPIQIIYNEPTGDVVIRAAIK